MPHELTHLVFDTAVKNPYHFPPRWLNEGLAVYLSEGYGDSWRAAVKNAVDDDEIIPLDGLTGQFPTTRDQFFLAYGESVSAVDYLVRTYGQDALVKLVRSYADGVTDDEAFQAGDRPRRRRVPGWLAGRSRGDGTGGRGSEGGSGRATAAGLVGARPVSPLRRARHSPGAQPPREANRPTRPPTCGSSACW